MYHTNRRNNIEIPIVAERPALQVNLRNGSRIESVSTEENPLRGVTATGVGYMDYTRGLYEFTPDTSIMPTFSPQDIARIIEAMNEKNKPKTYRINTEEIQSTMDMIAVFRLLVEKINPTVTENDITKFGLEKYVTER